jgi:hypothetical protein
MQGGQGQGGRGMRQNIRQQLAPLRQQMAGMGGGLASLAGGAQGAGMGRYAGNAGNPFVQAQAGASNRDFYDTLQASKDRTRQFRQDLRGGMSEADAIAGMAAPPDNSVTRQMAEQGYWVNPNQAAPRPAYNPMAQSAGYGAGIPQGPAADAYAKMGYAASRQDTQSAVSPPMAQTTGAASQVPGASTPAANSNPGGQSYSEMPPINVDYGPAPPTANANPYGTGIAQPHVISGAQYGADQQLTLDDLNDPNLSDTDRQYLAGLGLYYNPSDPAAQQNASAWGVDGAGSTTQTLIETGGGGVGTTPGVTANSGMTPAQTLGSTPAANPNPAQTQDSGMQDVLNSVTRQRTKPPAIV